MDPKHNRDKPSTHQETREHNKSNAGHREQGGHREGTQQEQKKRSGSSRE